MLIDNLSLENHEQTEDGQVPDSSLGPKRMIGCSGAAQQHTHQGDETDGELNTEAISPLPLL